MYPKTPKYLTYVTIEGSDSISEGAARPGFFRGVATVVTKLFNIVQPTNAYFGQKDGLQAIMVQQFVRDLNIPVKITVCPIVRAVSILKNDSFNRKMAQLFLHVMLIFLLLSVLLLLLFTSHFVISVNCLKQVNVKSLLLVKLLLLEI